MKYPKEWIDIVHRVFDDPEEDVLDALHKAGALKDVPRPKETWVCGVCDKVFYAPMKDWPSQMNVNCPDRMASKHKLEHYRQVIGEDE